MENQNISPEEHYHQTSNKLVLFAIKATNIILYNLHTYQRQLSTKPSSRIEFQWNSCNRCPTPIDRIRIIP